MGKWEEVSRKFTEPVGATFKVKGISPKQLDEMLYGFTVVELRNSRNGKIKFVKQMGDQT